MNTWISSVCFVMACFLAGCSGDLLTPRGASDGVQSASLSDGAVLLAAPNGFCVDPSSIERGFALMARCDTLGATGSGRAPLALITATTLAISSEALPEQEVLIGSNERVVNRQTRDALALVQVQGAPPDPSFDDTFWRGRGQVGDQILGLAIYTPKGAASLGRQGPAILAQIMRRTLAQSPPQPGKSATQAASGNLAGLFE
ncbi:MAG: hypothetical protein AAF601_05675 [Pseudomonadota bacterium]